jgi:predicted GH43/DUF377 family glycosyl hydrolase
MIQRFANNPIITNAILPPSQSGLSVECVLNPGAFRYNGKIGLILRVAERPLCEVDEVATLLLDEETGQITPWVISRQDPKFRQVDPRAFFYDEKVYLTTMSHLMVVWSEDSGQTFGLKDAIRIFPEGRLEQFGIEDCRVECIEDVYHLTYTAVSICGIAVGHLTTRDWQEFSARRVMLPPSNKDCALFPRRINGLYYCMHRPSAGEIGGNNMWLASSPDLIHWSDHRPLLTVREGYWDEQRIGAGAAPIETEKGWLEIYHGANHKGRYCLGAILLDRNEPWKVLARSRTPIMVPTEDYEKKGFYGDCVFTNGHIQEGGKITMYYGASDNVVCGAWFSIDDILQSFE